MRDAQNCVSLIFLLHAAKLYPPLKPELHIVMYLYSE